MEPPKVEKFSSANRGNGLRALVQLRPGELLFRSDPLAYTVCKGSRGIVCDRCLLGKEKLMRCSQCRVAKYCSAKCQVICNSFTVCNAEMQEVGVGLYPSMSLLNHSCDPNCSIVFNGPHLLLRAVRDIEAGEELTICYLDMLMTSEERRKQLRDQYCFECDCIRCQTQDKDADMLTGDEQVWKEVQESLKKIEELKAHWKWEQVLATCQAIISSNSERLPDINIYQLKVLDCAMDACINLGLLEEALFYGIRTMEPYRIFFPGSHPVRGVQVMKVGKLQLHQGMFPQAMKNLRLAFDIMRVTHGREHSLIEDLILLLEECDAHIRAS
ncbi:histone-lysine N-methyltransferase SMYD3 isoform X3 [Panthera onca]|uniref:histone-lysine N-methyltransferase SMYD3 isoform X3 n=1 Tax=Panthera onca TaxID=9690 RepID=UPI002955744C|nr:histone-lysine N-methyltransferase SMYD3 isoform X3 [Panthera onca]